MSAPVAMVAIRSEPILEQHAGWPILSRLPLLLSVQVPVASFRVQDLLRLEAGQMILTSFPVTDDVPLKLGAVQICWTEFEAVHQRMAVRMTRLA